MEKVCGVLVTWSFSNNFERNVLIFSVDNSVSHSHNCKNKFWILGEGPTSDINGSFGTLEEKFSINFSKASTKFCFSLYYNCDGYNGFLVGYNSIDKFDILNI